MKATFREARRAWFSLLGGLCLLWTLAGCEGGTSSGTMQQHGDDPALKAASEKSAALFYKKRTVSKKAKAGRPPALSRR